MRRKFKNIALCIASTVALTTGCKNPGTEEVIPEEPIVEEAQFAYSANKLGNVQVWLNRPSGSKRITFSAEFQHIWPRVSPDKEKLLYYRISNSDDVQDPSSASLWVYDITDGSALEILPENANDWRLHFGANWSPGGKQIVMSAVEDSSFTSQIFVCNADGSEPRKISRRMNYDYRDPVFHPDGMHIYCSVVPIDHEPGHINSEIHKLSIEYGSEERLTFNKIADYHPDVNSEGDHLVYESLTDPEYLGIGAWQLHMLNLSTLEETPLHPSEDLYFLPRFKSGTDEIYFVGLDIENLTTSIYRTDMGGAEPEPLLNGDDNTIAVDPF
ncbi:MAG: hypothetical protein Salg2KO_06750 [Salibacteraceae bacterium]